MRNHALYELKRNSVMLLKTWPLIVFLIFISAIFWLTGIINFLNFLVLIFPQVFLLTIIVVEIFTKENKDN